MRIIQLLFLVCLWTAVPLHSQTLPTTFTHTLTDGTDSYSINFSRFSSRGPLFEVAVQQSDGSFQTASVGDARTYIGTVTGEPGAVAACIRRSDGSIYTRMTFENGYEWIDYDGTLTIEERDLTPTWPTFGMRSGGAGASLYASDIFIDLTNRYYGTVGGTVDECIEMVDFSMTALNLIYMRDVNLINRIGRVQIRADLTNDPYANDGSVMANLLSTLATEGDSWVNGSDPTTDHDLVTVIQSLVGGGLATVGTVGTGRSANGGFSLGDFAGAARHEFGHNWGMSHYDGRGDGETQSPEGKTINSGNGLAKMSAPEAELALGERDDAIAVLTNLGNTAPSMPPRAADDRLTIDYVLAGQTLTVTPLDNDNDSNGESISIVSVDSTSLLGASVAQISGTDTLEVSFPGSYAYGYDYFRYQISDQSGRTSTAVVHLQMSPGTLEWELAPTPVDSDSLLMTASDKFEGSGAIEYFFEHVNGSQSSTWQNSRSYLANSLTTGQAQTFRVYARIANSVTSSLPSEDVSATPLSVSAGTIFTDTFDRTSVDDSVGQSGSIAPVGYTLDTFGTVTAGILSNQLHFDGPAGDGTYGGLAFIDDFNFGSPLMSAFDEVSIKVDIAGYSTVGSTRQMSLAIGQSLAELQSQTGANAASSPADLVVAFRQTTSSLEIYKNGTLISAESVTGNFPTAPTEMELVYTTSGYEEGSTASYEVYLDGRTTPHTSGTFTWSGTYQNYLALSSNLTATSLFDNLVVEVATTPGFTPPAINVPSFTPDPTRKYYIDSPYHDLRLAATGEAADPYTTSTSTTGEDVEWVFVDKGNGSWHIQLAAGGTYPRLRSRNNGEADMQATTLNGGWTYYDFTLGDLANTHFLTLPDHDASRSRLQIDSSGVVNFVPETSAGTWESFQITEVSNSFTPDPTKTYYIENPTHGYRIAADGYSEDAYTVPLSTSSVDTQWKFVEHSSGYWHLDRAAGGSKPRLRTDASAVPDMQETTSSGTYTQYDFTPSTTVSSAFYLTLPSGPAAYKRLRVLSNGDLEFTTTSDEGSDSSLQFVEVVADPDLVAHWPMDESTGTTVADISGNGFDGTQSNATQVTGFASGALDFDGSSSTVSIPASAFASISDEITISMWIYGGAGQARSDTLFNAVDASGGRVLNIHLPWSNSQVYWDAGYDGLYDRINKAAASTDFAGQWNHWVFTKDSSSGSMAIYLNGTLWHSGTGKTKSMTGITSASFGSATSGSNYEGVMDELMIYNVSLTGTEVADLYSEQVTSTQTMALNYTPSDYDNWALGLSALNLGLASSDYDLDGLSNDEERIWGLDPTDGASSNPYVETLNPAGTFQYTRRNPALSGMTFSIWTSTDLQEWIEDKEAVQESLSPDNAEVETVQVTIGHHLEVESVFVRVEAELEEEVGTSN